MIKIQAAEIAIAICNMELRVVKKYQTGVIKYDRRKLFNMLGRLFVRHLNEGIRAKWKFG